MRKAGWLFGLGVVGLAALWIARASRPESSAGDGPGAVAPEGAAPIASEPPGEPREREARRSREELSAREAEELRARLSGRVLGAEHGPLGEAEVLVAVPRAEESWGAMGFESSPGVCSRPRRARRARSCDEAGHARYRFAHLDPGPWSFEYQAFLSEDETPIRLDVELVSGANPAVRLAR